MSKKNYIEIAKVLREVRAKHPVSDDLFENIVDSLANVLKKDNSRFEYSKFWNYVNKQLVYSADSLANYLPAGKLAEEGGENYDSKRSGKRLNQI